MSEADAVRALIARGRGGRPYSLNCAEAEDAVGIALALLVEMSVANDRIDRLERVVDALRGSDAGPVAAITYDGAAADDRRAATDALIARVLHRLLDPRDASPRPGDAPE